MTPASPSPRSGGPRHVLLRPGETCESLHRADRAAVLVDGEAYFGAVASALERAERRVFLVGWDFHTGIRLRRGTREAPAEGPTLVAFLEACLERRPQLEIFVLEWDFAMIYALERQLLPRIRFGVRHPRLHFALDGEHPIGASHHQKLVVVDDAVAFAGGFDLAPTRWDTRTHAAFDPRRRDPDAGVYQPFHDVGMAVGGEAAGALAALARRRFARATGWTLAPVEAPGDPWPPELRPQLEDVEVGLVLTDMVSEPKRQQVEALYLESVRRAERAIYAENQYLTSDSLADALAARLRDANGPDVVLVGPRRCSGWLEEGIMGGKRARIVERLRAADRYGRLRVLYPVLPGVDAEAIRLHAKLMVVDDRLLRIGSANLANRSFGLDSELDLAVEATPGSGVAATLEGVRDDLLAEHLGRTPREVREAVRRTGSLVRGIDALAGGERSLRALPTQPLDAAAAELERWLPGQELLDPERPVPFDELVRHVLPEHHARARRRRRLLLLAALALIVSLAALWQLTPLQEWVRPAALAAFAEPLRASAWGPVAFVLAMVLGGFLMIPVVAMVVASALLYGPAGGFVVAWIGAMASALAGYGAGRGPWRRSLQHMMGPRLRRLSQQVGRRGTVAMALLRLVPVAPYTAVNMAAGISHVSLRDYLLGTVIGMTPGILALTLLSSQVARAVRDPQPGTVLAVLAIAAAGWGLLLLVRRALESRGGG